MLGKIGLSALMGAIVFFSPVSSVADDFNRARDALCEKTKLCAMNQMENAENMSDQMKTMILQSMERMCDGMREQFSVALQMHDLYEPAVACMQSLAELECGTLMDNGAETAPACVRFRELSANR